MLSANIEYWMPIGSAIYCSYGSQYDFIFEQSTKITRQNKKWRQKYYR